MQNLFPPLGHLDLDNSLWGAILGTVGCGAALRPHLLNAKSPPQCDDHRYPLTSPVVPCVQNHPQL